MSRGDGLYKSYLSNPDYFAPQVRATLFPSPEQHSRFGGRWARQPVGESLEIGEGAAAEISLSIDFLEVIQTSLPPGVTFGLAHLSMADADDDDDRMLLAARLLEKVYRKDAGKGPYFALQRHDGITQLQGNWLHAALADELFGSSHETAARRAHVMTLAYLADHVAEDQEPAWRRALGRGKSIDDAQADLSREEIRARDAARTDSFGAVDIAFFGLATTLSCRKPLDSWLFTFRTYWSESVLFALLQQTYLEQYARELAALGPEPFGAPIDRLFEQWVAFLNVLWWREPSYTTDVPGRILTHVHEQHNTELLFGDIEKAFATYVEARHHRTQDTEREALRSLQTYGAVFAVLSATAAVAQVADVAYVHGHPALLLVVICTLGALAGIVSHAVLRRRA